MSTGEESTSSTASIDHDKITAQIEIDETSRAHQKFQIKNFKQTETLFNIYAISTVRSEIGEIKSNILTCR